MSVSARSCVIHPLESWDPSVELGYELEFDKEMSLEFRNLKTNESDSKLVRIRILTIHDDQENLEEVRFEIIDDSDLFFFVEASFDSNKFEEMKEKDQLLIDFNDFPSEVESMLNDSLQSDSESQVNFIENGDETGGVMEFNQLLDLKSVEIFSLEFKEAEQELIQKHAQYRYSKVSYDLTIKKALLEEFNKRMQEKHPMCWKKMNETQTSSKTMKRTTRTLTRK